MQAVVHGELQRTFPLVLVSLYRRRLVGFLDPCENGFLHLENDHSKFGRDQLLCQDQTYRTQRLMELLGIRIPLRTGNPPQTGSGPTPVSVSVRVLQRVKDGQRRRDADPSGGVPTVVFTVVGKETLAGVFSSDPVEPGGCAPIRG
jgi:hypothetical protein